jgi:hypothetical protein
MADNHSGTKADKHSGTKAEISLAQFSGLKLTAHKYSGTKAVSSYTVLLYLVS